ncbi:hypothetical protein [Candidatus Thiosymbion oneisti]|uniref:hypothetical protein n=1 Tax=Candidatus Thiosymbion oneisti TaxID=589554 RepID=UPI000B7E897E|nr:hypothetical protein [Candidatus Thiosymbion oneisti]
MDLVLEITALGLISLLIVYYLRKRNTVTYKKYLAVSDDVPLPVANCGEFDEPGRGPDIPLSTDDIDWETIRKTKGKMFVGVPDELLSEDPEVQMHFPVIAEGDSMSDYGICQGDVAWIKIDPSAYTLGDRILIMSRSRDKLKIRKLIEKLDGDRWRTKGCSRNSQEGKHAQKRFLGKVDFVTHRQGHCIAVQ